MIIWCTDALRPGDFAWSFDTDTQTWRRRRARRDASAFGEVPTSGLALGTGRVGVVAVYEYDAIRTLVVGSTIFDLRSGGIYEHRCWGPVSSFTASQGTMLAHVKRVEWTFLLRDPWHFDDPWGSWFPLADIARLANGGGRLAEGNGFDLSPYVE
jgi:hypothetical protein